MMRYYLYGQTPVMLEPTPSGGLRVQVFDCQTRCFYTDCTLYAAILFGRGERTQEIDQTEFERLTA